MRWPRYLITFGVLLQLACHSPTSPDDTRSQAYGRLSGVVTIGPNCPVEPAGQPCPTQPSAYALRKVLVYDQQKARLLFTVDIDSQGFYLIDLLPANYVVDIKGVGLDRSKDVPANVEIHTNTVTRLDISIDTGIR